MVVDQAGIQPTVVEGLVLVGRDGPNPSDPAFGMVLLETSDQLVLRNLEVRSGVGAAGEDGKRGAVGTSPSDVPEPGGAPRAAIETAGGHDCIQGPANRVEGGAGGGHACGGVDASGGNGGHSSCPVGLSGSRQSSGAAGSGGFGQGGLGEWMLPDRSRWVPPVHLRCVVAWPTFRCRRTSPALAMVPVVVMGRRERQERGAPVRVGLSRETNGVRVGPRPEPTVVPVREGWRWRGRGR